MPQCLPFQNGVSAVQLRLSAGAKAVRHMTSRELEEYRALRDTIRERGTARHWIVVVGFGLWGALALAVAVLAAPPVATLLPLLVLAVVFEAIFAIHTGVERVGR